MNIRRKRILFSMISMGIGFMIAIGIAEIGVRIWNRAHKSPSSLRHDEYLGWTGKPGGRLRYSMLGVDYNITLNSLGFNDKEWALENPGAMRIAFLGDSFTAGLQVASRDTFVAVAGDILRRKFPDRNIEVMNFGIPGYTIDQELLLYRKMVRRFHPEVVVLCLFTGNDFQEVRSNYNYGVSGYKPRFVEKKGKLIIKGVPVPKANQVIASPGFMGRTKYYLKTHFALYSFVAEKIRVKMPSVFRRFSSDGVEGSGIVLNDDAKLAAKNTDIYRDPLPVEWRDAEKLYFMELNELKREVERDGARLAFVSIPYSPEVNDQKWKELREEYKVGNVSRDALAGRIGAESRKLGIPALDLTSDLRLRMKKENDSITALYFKEEGHFNADGHKAAGESIARLLEERQIVK